MKQASKEKKQEEINNIMKKYAISLQFTADYQKMNTELTTHFLWLYGGLDEADW